METGDPAMVYSLLADLVEGAHLAFLAFTLLGQVAILVGLALRWTWVRNPGFRIIHLGCILFVALEYIVGIQCPLTTFEVHLRQLAGEKALADASFVGRLMHELVFVFNDLDPDHWAFTVGYCGFAALVAATFFFAPPRRRKILLPQISESTAA